MCHRCTTTHMPSFFPRFTRQALIIPCSCTIALLLPRWALFAAQNKTTWNNMDNSYACAHAHPDLRNLHGMRHMHTSDIVMAQTLQYAEDILRASPSDLHSILRIFEKNKQPRNCFTFRWVCQILQKTWQKGHVGSMKYVLLYPCKHAWSIDVPMLCMLPCKMRILESCAVQIRFHLEEIQHII